jgi:hypothetical protein
MVTKELGWLRDLEEGDAGGFGENIVATTRYFAEFGYRCGEVSLLGGVADGGAVSALYRS